MWWPLDQYEIPFSIHRDEMGEPPGDLQDLESIIIVSWREIENRLHIFERRHDDSYVLWDEDTNGDAFELHVDGDHAVRPCGSARLNTRTRGNAPLTTAAGRKTTSSICPAAPLTRWTWFWPSQATWYDQPKYMDMAYAYESGYFLIESGWTAWDDFIWNDEEASVQTDLREGNIIHLGVGFPRPRHLGH